MDIARPYVYGFGLFFGTFFIILLFFIKIDQNTQAYCEDAVNKFVGNACSSGYIAPSDYIEMMQRINNTGNLYNVRITHNAKVVMPYVDESGSEVKGSYVKSEVTYNKEEILEEMFPFNTTTYNNYPLGNGDYIQVTLSLKQPTLAGKLFARLSRNEIKTIRYNKGGYVGNNEENGMLK